VCVCVCVYVCTWVVLILVKGCASSGSALLECQRREVVRMIKSRVAKTLVATKTQWSSSLGSWWGVVGVLVGVLCTYMAMWDGWTLG